MLNNKMNLKAMLEFSPDDELMALLPLETTVYLKIIIVNDNKNKAYNDLRLLFNPVALKELKSYVTDVEKTIFYDFDAPDKFIIIMELHSTVTYQLIHDCLEDILNKYNFGGDIIINFYTHDNKNKCLSLYNGIITTKDLKK